MWRLAVSLVVLSFVVESSNGASTGVEVENDWTGYKVSTEKLSLVQKRKLKHHSGAPDNPKNSTTTDFPVSPRRSRLWSRFLERTCKTRRTCGHFSISRGTRAHSRTFWFYRKKSTHRYSLYSIHYTIMLELDRILSFVGFRARRIRSRRCGGYKRRESTSVQISCWTIQLPWISSVRDRHSSTMLYKTKKTMWCLVCIGSTVSSHTWILCPNRGQHHTVHEHMFT